MPRLIFKCPYIRSGNASAKAHLTNYVRYMATRDGAEAVTPEMAKRSATKKQQEMIKQIVRDFPLSKGMFEYEDYLAAPTLGNASEFITRALEDNYDRIAKKENYLNYIAQRPNAEKISTHALFSDGDDPLILAGVVKEVAQHKGNVWLPIISLRREDAARLGYDRAEAWQALLRQYAMEMAEALKIPWGQFRWYASFHNEGHHPHVHMVCYSADSRSGFLTKDGIAKIKSGLVQQIFRQELTELYIGQTERRDELIRESTQALQRLLQQMENGTLQNECMGELLEQLALRLRHTTGKKQYGYLQAPLKKLVDEIADELAKDERVAKAYDLWYELREEVLQSYRSTLPKRLPLSQQKEFKQIRNLIIREAVWLGETEAPTVVEAPPQPEEPLPDHNPPQNNEIPPPENAPAAPAAPPAEATRMERQNLCLSRLLYHMSRIFREQTPVYGSGGVQFTDSKLRQKIREKKMALGHKADDHEESGIRLS